MRKKNLIAPIVLTVLGFAAALFGGFALMNRFMPTPLWNVTSEYFTKNFIYSAVGILGLFVGVILLILGMIYLLPRKGTVKGGLVEMIVGCVLGGVGAFIGYNTVLSPSGVKAVAVLLALLTVLLLVAALFLFVFGLINMIRGVKSRNEPDTMKQHMGMRATNAISNTVIHIVLIVMSVIWLMPFVFIVLQSFRVDPLCQVGYVIPKHWGFDNYVNLFVVKDSTTGAVVSSTITSNGFLRWYLNTLIIAIVAAIMQTAIQLCMSYTLSRFRFKMRKPLMQFMLILGMFPGILAMIILYNVLKDLGLTQEHAVPGLILVYVASSGMGYYVSKGFFDTIPKSLDEAARIDGANRAQVFWKIILPLAKPIVIYSVLTAFMAPWGDYVFAQYISRSAPQGMNVAVGLYNWLSNDQINQKYTMFCAGGVVVAIPVTALFLCLQRYYVEGVTGGAVKG